MGGVAARSHGLIGDSGNGNGGIVGAAAFGLGDASFTGSLMGSPDRPLGSPDRPLQIGSIETGSSALRAAGP